MALWSCRPRQCTAVGRFSEEDGGPSQVLIGRWTCLAGRLERALTLSAALRIDCRGARAATGSPGERLWQKSREMVAWTRVVAVRGIYRYSFKYILMVEGQMIEISFQVEYGEYEKKRCQGLLQSPWPDQQRGRPWLGSAGVREKSEVPSSHCNSAHTLVVHLEMPSKNRVPECAVWERSRGV